MKIPKIILNSSYFSSSSSPIPLKEHRSVSAFDNLVSMRHELSNILAPKIRIVNELDDSADKKDDTVLFNPVGLDEVIYLSIVKCPICNFDIEVYSHRGHSEDYKTCNMICPVCDEKFGEDEIRIVHNTSYPILRKKHGVSNVAWEMHQDKKDSNWDNASLRDRAYNLSLINDSLSDEEDTISNVSDVTGAKVISIEKSSEELDAPDISDEQNIQERSNKAAFSQELLMSTIFLQ